MEQVDNMEIELQKDTEKQKEITNSDIFKCLLKIQEDNREQKNDMKNLNRKMEARINEIGEKISRNNDNLKRDIKEIDTKNTNIMDRMNGRMDTIEKEMQRYRQLRYRTSDKLQDKIVKKMNEEKEGTEIEKRKDDTDKEKDTEEEKEMNTSNSSGSSYRSDWARQVEEEETAGRNEPKQDKVKDKKIVKETAKEKMVEKTKVKKKIGMKKLRNWFADETDENDSTISSEDEWNEIGREAKNKQKKKKAGEKRKRRREETTEKAAHIIGVGPITKDTLQFFMRQQNNIEKAKLEAIKEWMSFYLKFEDEEINNMKINATQIAAKGDIIYVSFDDRENIKDLHVRAAECKNENVTLRNYIPPQYFNRYVFISNICKEMRNHNTDLKTQLRFGHGDVQILTKLKGSEEPYKVLPLENLEKFEQLPQYEHNIDWTKKHDRPHRRNVTSSPNRGLPTSRLLQQINNPHVQQKENTHQLSRTPSLNKHKKTKLNTTSSLDGESSSESDDRL